MDGGHGSTPMKAKVKMKCEGQNANTFNNSYINGENQHFGVGNIIHIYVKKKWER